MVTSGVRCRGTCKDGHTTEAVAEPGRVTWHGTCAEDGCDRKVYCRRVPADTPAPPPDTKLAETDPHRVLEVPGYRDEPPPAEPDDDAGDEPTEPTEPTGDEPRPKKQQQRRRRKAAAASGAPAAPVTPTPPRPQQPRGALGRLRARLAADRPDDTEEGQRLFGHW